MTLLLQQLVKSWSGRRVLDQFSLNIPAGHIQVLLGPSGAGKTTLLRLIAGFESLDQGSIAWQDQVLDHTIASRQQLLSYAPQQMALTPHWTVSEHLHYASESLRLPTAELTRRIQQLLQLCELQDLAQQPARLLSGGEQRRVGLARALVRQSKLVLLDEPLAELDRPLRERMLLRLRSWFSEHATTVLWVTHDWSEAAALQADVAVLLAGQIAQSGSLLELQQRSLNAAVAEWLGTTQLVN